MAMFETWLRADLKKPVAVEQLTGKLFSADNQGNLVGVEIMDNGQPATITGGVNGYIVRADGATVVVTGTLTNNRAYIILPQSAYTVVGRVSIVIKVGTTTVGACTAHVYQTTTDTLVDPGHVIPSIEELLAKIADCEAATTAANTAAANANTKAALADEKATAANTAATNANTKAALADEKATAANTAATNANTKAALADEKATAANTAATNANTKAALADEKATAANTAASSANTAATNANTKAALADEKATAANTAAGSANSAASSANSAASAANTAAGKIDNMTVAASGLAAGTSPTATISEVSGHKHIAFGIPKGDTGATPDFSIGTVQTLSPGSSATASITGTAEAPVLNLGIPKGDTGSAENVYGTTVPMSPDDSTKVSAAINAKVDKVTGKQLSTEDYTSAEKTKLAGIATGATANVVSNSLSDTSTTNALSAAKGKDLNDAITGINTRINYRTIQDYVMSQLDANGDKTVTAVSDYPTKPGAYRITTAVTWKPSGTSNYGTLIIFDGGSYTAHLYVDVGSTKKMYFGASSTSSGNVTAPANWYMLAKDSEKVSKSGDTMTGDLHVEVADTADVVATNTTTQVSAILESSSSGNHGIWSTGYYKNSTYTANGKWMLYRDANGSVLLNGDADTLDGHHGSYFLPVSGGTMTGDLGVPQIFTAGIEFSKTTSSSTHGGFIDFHYKGSSNDFTSRIIEDASYLYMYVYDSNGNLRNAKLSKANGTWSADHITGVTNVWSPNYNLENLGGNFDKAVTFTKNSSSAAVGTVYSNIRRCGKMVIGSMYFFITSPTTVGKLLIGTIDTNYKPYVFVKVNALNQSRSDGDRVITIDDSTGELNYEVTSADLNLNGRVHVNFAYCVAAS